MWLLCQQFSGHLARYHVVFLAGAKIQKKNGKIAKQNVGWNIAHHYLSYIYFIEKTHPSQSECETWES